MPKAALVTPTHPLYCYEDLVKKRRLILLFARSLPPGTERNSHRQIASSLRRLFRNKQWLATNTNQG